MAVFTNQLFTTGSFIFNREGAVDNTAVAFVSMSIDTAGNVTASLAGSNAVDRTAGNGSANPEVGDIELRFGSAYQAVRSKNSDFSIKRRFVKHNSDSGYELRIARTWDGGFDAGEGVKEWFQQDTDYGISLRCNDNEGSAGKVTPVRIGGGLTESPVGNTEKDKYATLIVSASQHGTNYMRTILRLDNGALLGTNTGGANGQYGSHLQCLMGDPYSSDPKNYGTSYGTNLWMGNFDYPPQATNPAQDWRGCFYIAYGDRSTRSIGLQPPKLGTQNDNFADGACWLMLTASESGGSGGGETAPKVRVGDSYRGTVARGSQMIFPSSSLHVLGDGSNTDNMLFFGGEIIDNRDYVAQFETVAVQGRIGTSFIGLKAGGFNRGDGQSVNGSSTGLPSKMTIALGAINYTAGQYAVATDADRLHNDSGDFWLGMTQHHSDAGGGLTNNQQGPQTRMFLSNSGSMNLFSGSAATASYNYALFPPKPGVLNNPVDSDCQFIPSGTLNLWGLHKFTATAGQAGHKQPSIINFVRQGSIHDTTNGYPDSRDILGRIAFRNFHPANRAGESAQDGLGAYIESTTPLDWTASLWASDLNFYTRNTEAEPQNRMTIQYDGAITMRSKVGISGPTGSYALQVNGSQYTTGDVLAAGTIYAAGDITHTGDTNTKVAFTTDNISLEAGGNAHLAIDGTEGILVSEYIKHSGDTDTYIQFGDNVIDLYANNTRGIQINSSGEVGIKGAASSGYAITTGGSADVNFGGDMVLLGDIKDSASTIALSFDGSGNINNEVSLKGSSSQLTLTRVATSTYDDAEIHFKRSNSDGLEASDGLGTIWWRGSEDDSTYKNGAAIGAYADGTWVPGGDGDDEKTRLTFWTNGTDSTSNNVAERMRITSEGNVGIGSTTSSTINNYRFYVEQQDDAGHIAAFTNTSTNDNADLIALKINHGTNPTTSNNYITFSDGGGNLDAIEGNGAGSIQFTGNAAGTYSDMRLKSDLKSIDQALGQVNSLEIYDYQLTRGPESFRRQGFSAQQLKTVAPQAVYDPEELGKNIDKETGEAIPESDRRYRYMKVNPGMLAPLLAAAIQEMSKKIDDLESEIASLKS